MHQIITTLIMIKDTMIYLKTKIFLKPIKSYIAQFLNRQLIINISVYNKTYPLFVKNSSRSDHCYLEHKFSVKSRTGSNKQTILNKTQQFFPAKL